MAKRSKASNRGRVTKLWEDNPNCHWCNVLTTRVDGTQQRLQPHSATFDHLYHRTEPQRHTRKGRNAGVLACYACNQRRGKEAHYKSLPAWNRFLIRHNFPIPVWKIRKRLAHIKRRFRFITKRVNWAKRHVAYEIRKRKNNV